MILIRRPWTRQPQGTDYGINPQWAARGCQAVALRGRVLGKSTRIPGVLTATPRGVGPSYLQSSTGVDLGVPCTATTWSLLLVVRLVSSSGYDYAFSGTGGGSSLSLADSDFSPSRLLVYVGGKRHVGSAMGIVVGETAVIAYRANGAGSTFSFFKNGEKATDSSTGTWAGVGNWAIRDIVGDARHQEIVPLIAIFPSVALSDVELRALTLQPYSVISSLVQIIPGQAASSGLPTLTALTASNITTSGWRATLTAA